MTNPPAIQVGSNDWRDQLIVELNRTGGDPSHLFELLEVIIAQRAWEDLHDTTGNPVGSFRRLIEAPPPIGCGQKADKVLKLIDIEHRYERDDNSWHQRMTVLRDQVRELMGIETEAVQTHGGDRKSSLYINLNERKKGGTSREYTVARLKRDAPDIADLVISDEITAAEGMRQLKARQGKPSTFRQAINMDNAQSAAETIFKYMSHETIEQLIEYLQDGLIEVIDQP